MNILISNELFLFAAPATTVASSVQIECARESIIVHINTEGKSRFHGLVYPRGLSKNSTCLHEFRNEKSPVVYTLPLRSCNTMPTELVSTQNYSEFERNNCTLEMQINITVYNCDPFFKRHIA